MVQLLRVQDEEAMDISVSQLYYVLIHETYIQRYGRNKCNSVCKSFGARYRELNLNWNIKH